MRMASVVSCLNAWSLQLVKLFEKDCRCGLVGGAVSLGWTLRFNKLSLGSVSLILPVDQDVSSQLLSSAVPTMTVMDSSSETVRKPTANVSSYKLPWS